MVSLEGLEDQGNKGKGNPGSADQIDLEKTAEMANPPGIPASQIVPGDEDLYILKSQVVPPVCPACPTVQLNGSAAAGVSAMPSVRPLPGAIVRVQEGPELRRCFAWLPPQHVPRQRWWGGTAGAPQLLRRVL